PACPPTPPRSHPACPLAPPFAEIDFDFVICSASTKTNKNNIACLLSPAHPHPIPEIIALFRKKT
ncbi:MAG TPA: hypothetical protein PKI62_10665, partial [bacterium]|nr:hypothetical protein [bacterium]